MKWLTLVGDVFVGTLAIPELDGRFLHNHLSDPESDCRRLLGPMPAVHLYKVCSEATILHVAIVSQVGWEENAYEYHKSYSYVNSLVY